MTDASQKTLEICERRGIEQIPHLVLTSILSKTDFEMMLILKLVCKKWNEAASTDMFYMAMLEDYCSKNMIITKFKIQEAKYPLIPKHFENHSWRDIFQLKRQVSQGQNKKLGTQIIEYHLVKSIKYEGELKNDEANGWGREFSSQDGCYEGEWRNGKKNGKGKMVRSYNWPDKKKIFLSVNKKYEGEFEDDQKNGWGTESLSIRCICEGKMMDFNITGHRHLFPRSEVYEGQLRNGKKNGKGKMICSDGETYEGEWKDDQKNGQGKFIYVNSDVYEGEWKDNQKHGVGKMTYSCGTVYEGDWKYDQKHGEDGMTYSIWSILSFFKCSVLFKK